MDGDREIARVLRRTLVVLRDDLQSLCECECLGGLSEAHGAGPLQLDAEAFDGASDLVGLIRDVERLVGRGDSGPAWLDAVIDGRRRIVTERVA